MRRAKGPSKIIGLHLDDSTGGSITERIAVVTSALHTRSFSHPSFDVYSTKPVFSAIRKKGETERCVE